MQFAQFKLSKSMNLLTATLAGYTVIGVIILPYLRGKSFDINFLNIGLVVVVAALAGLVNRYLRLTVTDSSISISFAPLKGLVDWQLNWQDITEVVLIYAPFGAHKLIIKNKQKQRQLLISMWRLERNNVNLEEGSGPLTLFTYSKQPQDYAVYHALVLFKGAVREASSREATEEANKQIQLSNQAGRASVVALCLAVLAVIARVADQSSVIDKGLTILAAGVVAGAIAVGTLYYLRKDNTIIASLIIGILCSGCGVWAAISSLNLHTHLLGKKENKEFKLIEQDDEGQKWRSTDGTSLTLTIYAKTSERRITELNTVKIIEITRGALGSVNVSRNEIRSFIAKD